MKEFDEDINNVDSKIFKAKINEALLIF